MGLHPLAWLEALPELLRRGAPVALVVTANGRGSTPRESGATMLVTADAMVGTIGGGHLEFEALAVARAALDKAGSPSWIVRFPLAARLGQCCGGVTTLVFSVLHEPDAEWVEHALACMQAGTPFALATPIGNSTANGRLIVTANATLGTLGDRGVDGAAVAAARGQLATQRGDAVIAGASDFSILVHTMHPDPFHVLVFGNGHVARSLVHVLGALPVRVRWIDARESDFPPHVPDNVEVIVSDAPDEEVERAPTGACVVVMTHSHALDFDIVEAALRRDDWRYLGLIGSRAKRAQFERQLAMRGKVAGLARVVCPVGVSAANLRSKEPGVIALGVATELMSIRERAARKDMPGGSLSNATLLRR